MIIKEEDIGIISKIFKDYDFESVIIKKLDDNFYNVVGKEKAIIDKKDIDIKLIGHGRIVCEKCGKLIVICRCFKCKDNITYSICEECKGEKNDSI